MSRHTIETIPDEMFASILDWCPLTDKMKARQVCKQWNAAVLQVLFTQKQLKVLPINCDKGEWYRKGVSKLLEKFIHKSVSEEQLKLTSIPTDYYVRTNDITGVHYLLQWCRGVSHLELNYLARPKFLDGMAPLLTNWSLRLTSVSLKYIPKEFGTIKMKRTVAALNSLPLLRALSLQNVPSDVVFSDQMPVLGRLERFKLVGYTGNLLPLLKQLGARLEYLHLDMVRLDSHLDIYHVLGSNFQFAINVNHLVFGEFYLPSGGNALGQVDGAPAKLEPATPKQHGEILAALISKLTNKLFTLDIRCASKMEFSDVTLKLLSYANLTKLYLCYRSTNLGLPSTELNSITAMPLLALRSIRLVRIRLCNVTAESYDQLMEMIGKAFTNARRVHIECEDQELMDRLKVNGGAVIV